MASGTRQTSIERWSALGLTGLLGVAAALDGVVGSGSFVSSPIALLLVAASGGLLGAWTPYPVAAAGVLTTATALTYANQRHFPQEYAAADDLAFFLLAVGAPALLGATLIRRIRQVRELDSLRRRLAARRRDDVAAARLGEQQRIELAVQHRLVERLGAIALRAEGATGQDSQSARAALAEIEQTSRAGLEELRQALGVLHEEPERRAVDQPPVNESGRPPSSPARVEQPPRRADILLVLGLGAAMAVESLVSGASRGPAWANVALAFVVTAPLVERRRHPLAAAAGLMALGTAYSAVLTPLPEMVTSIAPFLVAAHAIGAFTRGWWRLAGTVVIWLGYALLGVASPPGSQDPEGVLPTLVWSVLAVGAGVLSASWNDRADQMQELLAQVERLRDADVALAVARQRQRHARDLHDTVAHALSVVCLNAGAAQVAGPSAVGALKTIADAARTGTAELRHGLHALEPAERLDAPSMRLIAKQLGIDLDLVVPTSGDIAARDTALLLRVLREALVNVARHASGAHVHAAITADEAALRIEVLDTGAATGSGAGGLGAGAQLGAGVGLRGLAALLRERDGTLEFGPLPSRGFRVAASLPVLRATAESPARHEAPPLLAPARPVR